MTLYLTRAKYTQESFKNMLAKPADREGPGRAMLEAAGLKTHHMWYSSDGAIVCVIEGDFVSGASVGMVMMASGAFASVESVELMTMAQQLDAMKRADKIAAAYRPPGKT